MSYDLEVRSDANYGKAIPLADAAAVVEALPGLARTGPDAFVLDRIDAGLHVAVDLTYGNELEEGQEAALQGMVNVVSFSVAYPFLEKAGPVALEMAFQVAEALGWTVYDPQADSDFTRESQAAALQSQGASGQAARIVLEDAATAQASLGELFGQEMWNHRLFGAAACFVVAAVAGAWAMLDLGGSREDFDDYYPLLVSVGGVGLILLKGFVQAYARFVRSRSRQRAA